MPEPFSPDTGSSPDCCDVVLVPRLVGFFKASMMLGWNQSPQIDEMDGEVFLNVIVVEAGVRCGSELITFWICNCNVDVPASTMTSLAGLAPLLLTSRATFPLRAYHHATIPTLPHT